MITNLRVRRVSKNSNYFEFVKKAIYREIDEEYCRVKKGYEII